MSKGFFKFPSTPHLTVPSGADIRSNKVMTADERETFLCHALTVEEKIDGANLGISFDAEGNLQAQNRGTFLRLPEQGQWKKLGQWLAPRADSLLEHLSDRYILFGEWCYAQHSVPYNYLPNWFLGFDLYDRATGEFFSVTRRDDVFQRMGIIQVPQLAQGRFTYEEIDGLLNQSTYGDHQAEGLYIRYDENGWLKQRAKVVRPEFIQSMDKHWSRMPIKPNRLMP